MLRGLLMIRLDFFFCDLCNILETRRQTTFLMCYNYEYQAITKFPDSVTYTRIAEQLAKREQALRQGYWSLWNRRKSLKATPEDL